MSYLVVPNSFAPKCPRYAVGHLLPNVHSISYCKCNFSCEFCFFKYYKDTNEYIEYSADQFKQLVSELLPRGRMFKFTGGEPTLNKELLRDLRIVKEMGGMCFLDTNGSWPKLIQQIVDEQLVDLFGISLKGLTETEALRRSGTGNKQLCWDNVLESMRIISENPGCNLIVTYVCYKDFELSDLANFSKLLERFDNIFLKINNYQPNQEHPTPELQPKRPEELHDMIEKFVRTYPLWKNRITLVDGPGAVYDPNQVVVI